MSVTAIEMGVAAYRAPLERRTIRLYLALAVADLFVLGASFYAVQTLYLGGIDDMAARMAVAVVPVFILLAYSRGVYSIDALQKGSSSVGRVAFCIFVAGTFHIVLTFLLKTTIEFSRVVFVGSLILSFVLISALHVGAAAWFRRRNAGRVRNVLLVDAGGPPIHLAGTYQATVSHIDPVVMSRSPDDLHAFGQMVAMMDRVIVSCPAEARRDWAKVLQSAGIRGEVTSPIMHDIGAVQLEREEGFTSILVATGPLSLRNRIAKRAMDLLGAGLALVVCVPLLLVCILAIKLEDGGPVLFIQRRMGRGNIFFNMLKLRTMSEKSSDAAGHVSTTRGDARITRVGKVLRRMSLDELPQLLNVLAGQMSIVGPRPHAMGSRAGGKLFWEVSDDYWQRHALKPGLTGLAQIRGYRGSTRDERDLTVRLDADLEYLNNWSPLGDIIIAARTARVMIHPNAY